VKRQRQYARRADGRRYWTPSAEGATWNGTCKLATGGFRLFFSWKGFDLFASYPTEVGHFVVHGKLGEGAMGSVFEAVDPALERRVALKFLDGRLAADELIVQRFLREARAVARLQHPNVVGVYFAGVHEGAHYYAMEYVDGRSLADVAAEGPLEPERAVDYLKQAARGLSAAWKAGVIHRDVKPGNLLLTRDGVVKVADFGIAKVLDAGNDLTATGVVVGTPHYLSPEQARGMELDCRSDIYSLGASFYHLLSGAYPFGGDVVTQVVIAHISQPLPPLRQRASGVPLLLCRVIERMMGKDPRYRFQTYEDLLGALDGALDGVRSGEAVQGTVVRPSIATPPAGGIRAATVSSLRSPVLPEPAPRRRWPLVAALLVAAAGWQWAHAEGLFDESVLRSLPSRATPAAVEHGLAATTGETVEYVGDRTAASMALALAAVADQRDGTIEGWPSRAWWADGPFLAGGLGQGRRGLTTVVRTLGVDLSSCRTAFDALRATETGIFDFVRNSPCRPATVGALRDVVRQELEDHPPAARWRRNAIVDEALEFDPAPGRRQLVAAYQNLLMTVRLMRSDPRTWYDRFRARRRELEGPDVEATWRRLEESARTVVDDVAALPPALGERRCRLVSAVQSSFLTDDVAACRAAVEAVRRAVGPGGSGSPSAPWTDGRLVAALVEPWDATLLASR